MDIFVTFLKVLQLVFCILVIGGVLFSSQKSEGLSGIMGSSSYSARSAKGMDEGMRRTITWLGVGLIANSILLGIIGI
ncbi:preprotein translocase subunit SecG [bacterium]|nr:preprotein translocase subunit SecG [bacterium]